MAYLFLGIVYKGEVVTYRLSYYLLEVKGRGKNLKKHDILARFGKEGHNLQVTRGSTVKLLPSCKGI